MDTYTMYRLRSLGPLFMVGHFYVCRPKWSVGLEIDMNTQIIRLSLVWFDFGICWDGYNTVGWLSRFIMKGESDE